MFTNTTPVLLLKHTLPLKFLLLLDYGVVCEKGTHSSLQWQHMTSPALRTRDCVTGGSSDRAEESPIGTSFWFGDQTLKAFGTEGVATRKKLGITKFFQAHGARHIWLILASLGGF
jgi:hypothetical protein